MQSNASNSKRRKSENLRHAKSKFAQNQGQNDKRLLISLHAFSPHLCGILFNLSYEVKRNEQRNKRIESVSDREGGGKIQKKKMKGQ